MEGALFGGGVALACPCVSAIDILFCYPHNTKENWLSLEESEKNYFRPIVQRWFMNPENIAKIGLVNLEMVQQNSLKIYIYITVFARGQR